MNHWRKTSYPPMSRQQRAAALTLIHAVTTGDTAAATTAREILRQLIREQR